MGRFNQSLLDSAELHVSAQSVLVQAQHSRYFDCMNRQQLLSNVQTRPTFTFHYEQQSLCSRQTNKLASDSLPLTIPPGPVVTVTDA